MKRINKRLYLDYNATSPLSDSVREYLAKGDFLFANPSSIHSSGKRSKRFLNQTKDYLFKLFGLDENQWNIIFHSGATEGINALFKGFALKHLGKGSCHALLATSDHSSVFAQRDDFERLGHSCEFYGVDSEGDFKKEVLEKTISNVTGPTLLNYTWVNNETGVAWDLDEALGLRDLAPEGELFIHVDAVQSVGKIEHWRKLNPHIDAYTYSAHKFGGMKGVGFSFVKKSFPFEPLIKGGGQQLGLRSGTENTDGIYSIKLALEDLVCHEDISNLRAAKNTVELKIEEVLGSSGHIVGKKAQARNANTISLVLKNTRADILMTAFDLADMDTSSGSACSSGAISPSRVLMAMGKTESEAKSALRLSLGPMTTQSDAKEIAERVCRVLSRFCS